MNTEILSIEIPSDILLALNKSQSELEENIKLDMAIKYYKEDKLTLGKAAQLVGLSRLEFENYLSKNKISISNLSYSDVEQDMMKIK